jgi:hypothetical protein
MKKIDFVPKPTSATSQRTADQWVMGGVGLTEGVNTPKSKPPAEPIKRLTIDVPVSLHRRFKTQCALQELVMADVIRELLEQRFPAAEGKTNQADEGAAPTVSS